MRYINLHFTYLLTYLLTYFNGRFPGEPSWPDAPLTLFLWLFQKETFGINGTNRTAFQSPNQHCQSTVDRSTTGTMLHWALTATWWFLVDDDVRNK